MDTTYPLHMSLEKSSLLADPSSRADALERSFGHALDYGGVCRIEDLCVMMRR